MPPPEPHRPYRALRHADYRRLWLAQTVSLTGSQMQATAIEWHVYLLTGSPLALGGVGLSRVITIAALSLWGGVVADRFDRRRVMMASQSAMLLVAAALAWITATGREHVALLYVLTAASSAAGSFATRRANARPRQDVLLLEAAGLYHKIASSEAENCFITPKPPHP